MSLDTLMETGDSGEEKLHLNCQKPLTEPDLMEGDYLPPPEESERKRDRQTNRQTGRQRKRERERERKRWTQWPKKHSSQCWKRYSRFTAFTAVAQSWCEVPT